MDSIKRILLVNIPTGKCNFKCPYCFITQVDGWEGDKNIFPHNADDIKRAFSKDRLGGPCFVNLCSRGETLIYPQSIVALKSILEQGHYVEVVTNGSITKRFEEISKFPVELLHHLSFKFSFHYTELKRLNLFKVYFQNINLMRKSGASINVELTPVDAEEPYIADIKKLCIENLGALPHTTIARDDRKKSIPVLSRHTRDEYYKVWSTFNSEMLDFKNQVFQQKRNEFCYAGDWSLYIDLFTGDTRKCYSSPVTGNIYNFDKPLKFEAIGACQISHCYNAHAMMTFGLLPSVSTPTYASIRNRVCNDGKEWLTPEVKSFYSSKLIDSNEEYSQEKKEEIIRSTNRLMRKVKIYRAIDKRFHKILNIIPDDIKSKLKRTIIQRQN